MPSSGGPGGQWNVAALLARRPVAPTKTKRFARGSRFESHFEYLVQWEDRDPTTGDKYEPSWEPTAYITPAAIEAYYIDLYEEADAPQKDKANEVVDDPSATTTGPKVREAAHDSPPEDAATATAKPKADDGADAPKSQKITRTTNANAKGMEKQGVVGGAAPASIKRNASPAPGRDRTKRVRVADMLHT